MAFDIAIDFGATHGRLTPRLNGAVRADLSWNVRNADFTGPLAVVEAFHDRPEFGASDLAEERLTAVGIGWPGYVNPSLPMAAMTNPPQWVVRRAEFERATRARLVLVHDGAAHLAATIKHERDGGAKVLRDIFGVGDGLEGANLTLDYPGSGIANGAIVFDEQGRPVLKTSEDSHGGMHLPVQGPLDMEEIEILRVLYQMVEEGLFADHSTEGCVSPDVLLAAKGLRLLAIAAGRVLGNEVGVDIQPEDVTTEDVLAVVVSGAESDDPRVKALRKWLAWHGDFCEAKVVGDNAYRGLVLGGLFAKLGVDVIKASEFRRRLCAGQHADKLVQTPVHLLVDEASGQKGVFAAIDLAA